MSVTNSDSSRELECGHTYEGQETISLPGVGAVCRTCHMPYSQEKWDNTLRSTKTHHRTGETSHHRTWLVGLDSYGRAVYHDEYNNEILRVVPMHDQAFSADRSGDKEPLREYPPHRGPGYGRLINGPDGRDLLVAVERVDTDANAYRKKPLAEWVVTEDEGFQVLTEAMLNEVKSSINQYKKDCYGDDVFPVEEAQMFLEEL